MPAALLGAGLLVLGLVGWLAFGKTRESTMRGVVTNVESRDIGHAAALMLLAESGQQQRFLIDPSVDIEWTPGHLRDHMLFAQPITVYYRRSGADLVAYRITD